MAQRPTHTEAPTAVTAEHGRAMTVDLLRQELPLGIQGYRYRDEDISNVVVAAAAQERSIESVCEQLVDAARANLARQYLADRLLTRWELEELEARLPAGPDRPHHLHDDQCHGRVAHLPAVDRLSLRGGAPGPARDR